MNVRPDNSKGKAAPVLSRLYIDREGNILVTDLWEELQEIISFYSKAEKDEDPDLQKWNSLR